VLFAKVYKRSKIKILFFWFCNVDFYYTLKNIYLPIKQNNLKIYKIQLHPRSQLPTQLFLSNLKSIGEGYIAE